MNVKTEILKYSQSDDVECLLWLFDHYHMQSQWQFVAKCNFIRYGTGWMDANRAWYPTKEGRILYAHHMDGNP